MISTIIRQHLSQLYSLFERPRRHPVENSPILCHTFDAPVEAQGSSPNMIYQRIKIPPEICVQEPLGPCGPLRWDVDYLRLLLLRHIRDQHKLWRLLLLLQLLHRSFCGRIWMWVSDLFDEVVDARNSKMFSGLNYIYLVWVYFLFYVGGEKRILLLTFMISFFNSASPQVPATQAPTTLT